MHPETGPHFPAGAVAEVVSTDQSPEAVDVTVWAGA